MPPNATTYDLASFQILLVLSEMAQVESMKVTFLTNFTEMMGRTKMDPF